MNLPLLIASRPGFKLVVPLWKVAMKRGLEVAVESKLCDYFYCIFFLGPKLLLKAADFGLSANLDFYSTF